MSGNYDYPPAVDDQPARRIGDSSRNRRLRTRSVRLQHLQDLLGTERYRVRADSLRAWATLNQEIEEYRRGSQDEDNGDGDSDGDENDGNDGNDDGNNEDGDDDGDDDDDDDDGNEQSPGQDRADDRIGITRAERQSHQLQSDPPRDERIRRLIWGHSAVTVNAAAMNQDGASTDLTTAAGQSPRRRGMLPQSRSSATAARNISPRFPSQRRPRDFVSPPLLNELISSSRLGSPGFMPMPMPQDPDMDREPDRWRNKRRKLDSDDSRESIRAFSYGQFGQVVPGALKMEIASCDGGTYDRDGPSACPENVLRNDSTVYCTKTDRCNLVLRHRGETPFCLRKIVIKAPKSSFFDAPIQEGMVFVSLALDELLAQTAQHRIQHPSSRARRQHRRTSVRSSQEYLAALRPPSQSVTRTRVSAEPGPRSDFADGSAAVAADASAAFRVTTEYNEDSDPGGLDIESSDTDYRPFVANAGRMQTEDDLACSDSDDDNDNDNNGDDHDNDNDYNDNDSASLNSLEEPSMGAEYSARLRRSRSRSHRGLSLTAGPAAATARRTGSRFYAEARSLAPAVLKPHAHFFIERDKRIVNVKFDPPPSGRFILIKLWSPHSSGGNIDIQSIIAHGYAGPRFFPACSFR